MAIDPAPFRGVLPLPFSALKAAFPVLGNPANYRRAVALTFEQFRFGFANAASEEEARKLYETYSVAGIGRFALPGRDREREPLDGSEGGHHQPDRGPLLIISGEKDNTVPWAIANASYKRQRRNPGITEIRGSPTAGTRSHRQRVARGRRGRARVREATPPDASIRREDGSRGRTRGGGIRRGAEAMRNQSTALSPSRVRAPAGGTP